MTPDVVSQRWNPEHQILHSHFPGCKLSPGKINVCQRAESPNQPEDDCCERFETQRPRVVQAASHRNTVVGTDEAFSGCGTRADAGYFCRTLWLLFYSCSYDTRTRAKYPV